MTFPQRRLSAGMLVVVPQGCWHRFASETGVKVMTVTPKPTQLGAFGDSDVPQVTSL